MARSDLSAKTAGGEDGYLAGQLLIAMPGMLDDQFAGTVVYVCEHNPQGAMGLVVNRPTNLELKDLFDRIELKLEIAPLEKQPVYLGGPVQTERGFVLHPQADDIRYSSSLTVPGGLAMTTSKDVLEAVSTGQGPEQFLMTLGYAGWSAGQLEDEISRNGWLNVSTNLDDIKKIIFETPYEQRYEKGMNIIGIDPSHLSGDVGHA
jgi:putative transcriptional regulator